VPIEIAATGNSHKQCYYNDFHVSPVWLLKAGTLPVYCRFPLVRLRFAAFFFAFHRIHTSASMSSSIRCRFFAMVPSVPR
jgi:hypothetical protein